MADIEARVNENSPIGFFTWCWTIVVEITDGRIGSNSDIACQIKSRFTQVRVLAALQLRGGPE
jgi:hypothetical protein